MSVAPFNLTSTQLHHRLYLDIVTSLYSTSIPSTCACALAFLHQEPPELIVGVGSQDLALHEARVAFRNPLQQLQELEKG